MSPGTVRSRIAMLASPAALALVVAAIAVASGAGLPRTVGDEWRTAGTLTSSRAYASATVLVDGAVLIVGGLDGDSRERTLTVAELFDPIAGASVALAQPVVGRVHHTATRTGERVVVTGGVEFDGRDWKALAATEVFDTRTRAWRKAAALRDARSDAGATALRDGRVLVAGGIEDPGAPSTTSVLYDPAADAWSEGPPLGFARVLHADVQLADGSVVLIGGQQAAGGSAEVYDPRAGAFRPFATLVVPRMLAQAVALPSGGVLVTGGLSSLQDAKDFAPRTSAELYEPSRGAFELYTSPAHPRATAKLTVLAGGVYQIGGLERGERATRSIEALGWR